MKHHDKTKDELLNELLEVQQKYNSLKELYDTDIVERKQAEQVLKNSEERLALVFNNTSDMLVLMEVEPDKKLRIAAVNHSYLESIKQLISKDDLSINDLVGKYRDEALIALGFSPENLDNELSYFLQAIASGSPILFEQIVPLGTSNIYLESNIVPVTDTAGRCTHLLYSVRDISERKFAEIKLKESEGKYRTLFENIPVGISITDLRGRLVAFNDSILDPGGYSRDDLIKMGAVENLYYNLSDREALIPLLKEKGTITQRPIKFKRKDGSPYDTLLTLSIIHINDQPMIQAVIEDITERKRVEESLRFFRMMIDKSNDAIEVIDVETGQFVDVNEKACIDLGYSRDELLSMKVFDVDPNQRADDFQQMILNTDQSNSITLESLHRRKDGSTFPVEVNIAVVKLEKRYTIAIVRDITERKHTEAALRESEARFRLLFEISADGISIVDVETKAFIYTNPAVCRMLGYTEKELKSMSIADIHPKQDLPWIIRELESLALGQKSLTLEVPCQRKDGRIIDTEITAKIAEIDGRVCSVGIHRDITEKKIAENKLRRSEELLKEAQLVGHIGSWELDIVNNIGSLSDEMYKLFNLNRPIDVTIETFLGAPVPEDNKMVREIVKKSLEAGKGVDFDFRTMTSTGEIRWIHERGTIEVDDKGKSKRVFGTCQDITERKLFELKLQESEANLTSAMKIAKLSTWEYNFALDQFTFPDQSFLLFNTTAEHEGGYTMSSEHFAQKYIHPDDRGLIEMEIRKAFETPDPDYTSQMEYRVVYAPDEIGYFTANIRIKKDADNRTIKALGVNQDITERKRMEEILIRINKAVESSGEAICMSDPQGYHFYHNKAFSEIFEYTVEEIQAAGGGTAVYENKDVGREVFDIIMGGGTWNGEVEMVSKSGRQFTALLRADAIRDETGIIVGLVGIHTDMTERKKVLKTLKENEQKFMTLAEQSPNLIFINCQGRIVYVNKKGIDAMGYSKEEFYSEDFDFFKLIADEYKELTKQDLSKQSQGIKVEPHDYVFITKTGERLDVVLSIEPIDYDGVMANMGTAMDITERKRAEAVLSESEGRTRALLDANPDMIFRVNREGIFLDYKADITELYVQNETSIIGKKNRDITPPEFADLMDMYIKQTLDSGELQQFEYQMPTQKRGLRDYEARMVASGKDEVIAVVRDVTDRKKAEESIKESEEKYRLLAESSPEMIYFIDTKGYVTYVNKVAAEQFHAPAQKLIGKHLTDIFPPDLAQQNLAHIQDVIATKSTFQNEVEIVFPTGSSWVDARLSPVIDEKNDVIGVLGLSYDITERKRAEKEIHLKNEQLLKLNAEKDKFFSIIAHDLKSPFSSIMGFSEILIKQVTEKNYQSVERYSSIIYESSQRAVDLLTNLMEWSRSQTGRMEFNPEYFEMVKLINEVTLLFAGTASQKSITITENLPPNAPVYADKNMMSTVLRNLISNAIKFTYKGGAIVVSTENKQGAQIIAVRDNGVGIPKSRIEKLFRIDENISTLGTEKEKGTGLGMVLCKEFVEKHGGKIWVESEEGKGSVFYFTIPSESDQQ